MSVAEIKKAIGALLSGLLGWFIAVLESGDTGINSTELIMLATLIVTTITVYVLKNEPPTPGAH